jgi:hypothetical protein
MDELLVRQAATATPKRPMRVLRGRAQVKPRVKP